MSEAQLKGKWALILGASSGFGAATALELAKYGVNIIGLHLDRGPALEQVRQLVEAIAAHGVQVHYLNMNIANAEKRREAVAQIKSWLGDQALHLVMHSVAFGSLHPFIAEDQSQQITQAQLEMTLDVMANSLVYWVQDLWHAGLLGRGSRVFSMTSAGSEEAFKTYGAVSAAKSALESHTRQLALELGRHGVMVNCIMAGVTDTPALRKIPGHEEIINIALRRNPTGRLTTPRDVAVTIRALCDPEIERINGAVIVVDGGERIGM
ncbi:MAG: SDR family oxidoreductase [Anaerolineae bacterium]|nr:SDR family oxidoreductase [Thermoflexales bacterium]MCX7938822.1 SDR family oxidoreductase [Thermoflexales bacterium]MDW8054877.1 SDR family oxidoreductase [Anaerolineae bacterium]MDW8293173.1 SDR family oxidoreductase [Anaerolineae bacterium]